MKIVLLEALGISQEELEEYAGRLREKGHSFAAYEKNTDPEVQLAQARDADVLMLANMPLSGEVIRGCPSLKFIDVAFTGVDHIDLEAARERGIAVSNASGYSNESVAELVLGMAIDLFRHVPQVEQRCREGGTKDGLVGRELKGHTVGIVGYGAIGRRAAELFHAMGCRILACSGHGLSSPEPYVEEAALEELLKQSDIVSLHCPLTSGTKGLISRERLALMKEAAILINAARGPVVDMQALAEALSAGRLAGAGVDVFEVEPPIPAGHPLLGAPNCLVTPHIAFATKESMRLRAEIVFGSLDVWLAGGQENIVLPRNGQ